MKRYFFKLLFLDNNSKTIDTVLLSSKDMLNCLIEQYNQYYSGYIIYEKIEGKWCLLLTNTND